MKANIDIRKYLPWNYCIKVYATGLRIRGHSQTHIVAVASGKRHNPEIEQALGEVAIDYIELGVFQLITLGV